MNSERDKVTALLPMKHNSERVVGKNIKDFNGAPLFTHVLNTLNSSTSIDEIIINTDSVEIAKLALSRSSKVVIHNRPEEICGDYVSMNEIIEFDIKHSGKKHFLQTHSTNPLLKVETIDKAIEEYFGLNSQYDSVFSVTKLQTRLYWEDGKPVNHNPIELLRTQDLPPVFEENSNFFIFSDESFANAGNKRIGLQPKMFEVDKIEAIDIDEPNDFILAETIHKMKIV